MSTYWNYADDLAPLPGIRQTRGGPRDLLQERGALLEASERIVDDCERSGRAMTSEERASLDDHAARIAGINARLEEYKRERIANNDSDLPCIFPF